MSTKILFDLYFTGEYSVIPEHMQAALKRYVEDKIKPGDFLTAVIKNDLKNAVGRADSVNLPLLPVYVKWLYNVAPGSCWGSPENFQTWIEGEHPAGFALG
jgi:hypothetical protein